MAYLDYRHCDQCGAKTFYDANLNYDAEDVDNIPKKCGEPDPYGSTLDRLGDWAVLCIECAKSYRTMIVPISTQEANQ